MGQRLGKHYHRTRVLLHLPGCRARGTGHRRLRPRAHRGQFTSRVKHPQPLPYNCAIASTFSSSDTSKYRCSAAIDDHPPRSWIAFNLTPALSNRVAQVRRLLWVLYPRRPRRSQAFRSAKSHAGRVMGACPPRPGNRKPLLGNPVSPRTACFGRSSPGAQLPTAGLVLPSGILLKARVLDSPW